MKQATLVVFDDPNIQNGQSALNNHVQEWLLQRNVKAKLHQVNLDNPPEVQRAIGIIVKFASGFDTQHLNPDGNSPEEMGFKQWWHKEAVPGIRKMMGEVWKGSAKGEKGPGQG